MIDDCIAFDFRGGGDYGPFRFKSSITINHFIIKNSTLYDFLNKLIDVQDVISSEMNIEIDKCTFYAWGGGKDGQYLFDIQDNDQANLKITNSILGKTNSETVLVRAFRFLEEAYAEISNSVMTGDFVVDTAGAYDRVPWDVDEWNEVDIDPEFEHPDTGNFNLPQNSDLRQMSEDGGPIGDPRWAKVVPTTVNYATKELPFGIYPVPVSDMLHIQTKRSGIIAVYNLSGRVVKEIRVQANTTNSVNVSAWNKGTYLIRMKGEEGAYKIVVE